MTRSFPRREPIAHSQKFINALLVATLLISGCAVTDPNRNGDTTVDNRLTCQGGGGLYQQDENGVTCHEAPVHDRDVTAQFLSGSAKTALYSRVRTALISAGLLALLNLLFHDKDDNNNCSFAYGIPRPCDYPP